MSNLMLGSFRYSLDEKNRVRIPAKFRMGLGDEPCIVPGRNGCLYMVSAERFEDFFKNYINNDPYVDNNNDFTTSIFEAASTPDIDSQGRFIFDKNLIKVFGIEKEMVFVGKVNFVEIWPSKIWDERFGILDPSKLDKMIDNLKKAGL